MNSTLDYVKQNPQKYLSEIPKDNHARSNSVLNKSNENSKIYIKSALKTKLDAIKNTNLTPSRRIAEPCKILISFKG